jgi:flagellar basal body rod protein FlgB
VLADDGQGNNGTHTATDTFNWTVANQAVTVTNPGTQSSAEGANVSLQINASDPSGNALNYSATGLPAGLQIDYASGLISGTMDGSAAETNGGVYQVTVLADDGQGNNGSTTFTWNVSHTNQAPTLDNPGDQVDQTGDVVSLPLSGYDGDGDVVSYSATGLPPGLSLDASSGIISGTLPTSAASSTPYQVTVTASDGTLTTSQTFNWFVSGNPVTLTSPGDQTNSEGNSVSLQLSATDANNAALTYQASGLPSGLSINSTTGLISGTVSSGDSASGPYTVTVMATDTQGDLQCHGSTAGPDHRCQQRLDFRRVVQQQRFGQSLQCDGDGDRWQLHRQCHVLLVGDESSGDGDQSRHAEQHGRQCRVAANQRQRSGAAVVDLCSQRFASGSDDQCAYGSDFGHALLKRWRFVRRDGDGQ